MIGTLLELLDLITILSWNVVNGNSVPLSPPIRYVYSLNMSLFSSEATVDCLGAKVHAMLSSN